MDSNSPFLRLEEIPGRGRSLVSTKPLRRGEVVLRDSPILLYSAFPFSSLSPYCDHCFKILPRNGAVFTCPSCSYSHFCSLTCLSTASSSSHSPWACQALTKLRVSLPNDLSPELQLQSRFLVAAYNLSLLSPPSFNLLLSLHGAQNRNDDASGVQFLHSLVPATGSGLFPPSLELTAALLSRDKFNTFGLMEPFDEKTKGRRSCRAYGIYPKASFLNHDCLPNACRFEYVDGSGSGDNREMIVRMIHDVPEGREVCLSYFPVNWRYVERQRRLLEDYGFRCECDRCRVEANWSDHEEEDGGNEAMEEEEDGEDDDDVDEAMEVGPGGGGDDDDEEDAGDFPHAYFFARFVCNREHCWGTLAPLPDAGKSNLLECNVCGSIKDDKVA